MQLHAHVLWATDENKRCIISALICPSIRNLSPHTVSNPKGSKLEEKTNETEMASLYEGSL
jgi:hypothetical protein